MLEGGLAKFRDFDIWNAVPLCLKWTVWREHNRRAFEGSERPMMDLKMFLLRALFDWIIVLPSRSFCTNLDLTNCCNLS